MTSCWTRSHSIDAVSSNFRYFLKPLPISDTEFCIAPPVRWPLGTEIDHQHFNGLYLYSTITDEWIKWIKYPKNLIIDSPASCIDNRKHIIYLYHRSGKLVKIYYKDHKIDNTKIDIVSNMVNLDNPRLVLIKNELHLIGGIINHKHLIFNQDMNKFIVCSKQFELLPFTGGFNGFSLNYMSSLKQLILLGGHKDEIYSYNICSNQWSKSLFPEKVPQGMSNFGYVTTPNKKFMILMGGIVSDESMNNNIFIFDIFKQKWFKCNILCPSYSRSFRAIIMNNDTKQEIIISGFIQTKVLNGKKQIFAPNYIIKLIGKWYKNQYVHLIEYSWHSKSHWKIKLDSLLNNVSLLKNVHV